jgi:adenine-specific DNA methylase
MRGTVLELAPTDNGLRDSAFAKNKDLPVHRWVPWIAGFSAQIVADCLTRYLPESRRGEGWILDPFAGVGTTLVEAYSHGHNVIGFEINPYAALAAKMMLPS